MPVTKPSWVYIGTPNRFIGQKMIPVAIVCHIAEGTLAGCDSWFQNPASQVSANFCVGTDGTIHCYVDPSSADAPWANGIINQPDAAFLALSQQQNGSNPNLWTISIEHAGNSGDILTAAQLSASSNLAAWCCENFGMIPDKSHFLGHAEIDSVNRAACPGWSANQWLEWEAAVDKWLASPTPTPPTPEPAPAQNVANAQARIATARAELAPLLAYVPNAASADSNLEAAQENLNGLF